MNNSKLDDILTRFDEIEALNFNYNRDYAQVLDQLENLSFIGEIDHKNYYLSILEQIFVQREDSDVWDLITLNDNQREEFYTQGSISDFPNGFRIADSLHIYINSVEKYVQIFNSRNIITKFGSPREDYGKVYTEFSKDSQKRYLFEKAEFKIDNLSDDDEKNARIKATFRKILKAFEISRTNAINVNEFDLKIYQNMSQYWGNLNNKERIINDEYQESDRPELIEVINPKRAYNINRDMELKNMLSRPGFDDIDYLNNGVTRKFNSVFEAENCLYSIIKYVNDGNITKFEKEISIMPQRIETLEKHYLSGKWPIASTEEEANALKKELTKFEVCATKFHDDVIVKMEVWDMGIVYVLTNTWDRRTVDSIGNNAIDSNGTKSNLVINKNARIQEPRQFSSNPKENEDNGHH